MFRRMFIGAAALGAMISLGLPLAQADQTQPASPGTTSSSGSGDWFRPTPPPQQNNPSAAGAAQNNPGDFPSDLVGQWVDAATRTSMTRAIYHQAEMDLSGVIRRAEERFERSHDYQKAMDDEQQAYADYLAARQKALASLDQNARYQELQRMQTDLAHRLSAGRENHELTHDDIVAMAELKLSYASEARSLEVQALDADTAVKDARDKMVSTSRTVSSLRSDFDFNLPDNNEVIAARRNVENARIAYLTASAYLNATGIASSAATNFSYYYNGPAQPRVYNYADPFGFGYGLGTVSPYWTRY